ncbi:MAG: YgiQ family radical protein, partial [Proteobacteria bacterium]|nr:YgiQ family radical protein [Pseudomonadota bacterium]
PSPMALATAMYHTGRNPLKGIHRDGGETVFVPKGLKQRRLHKAFLRYHDPENWPLLREVLKRMGRSDLIGNGKRHLIPSWQPAGTGATGGEGARLGRKHGSQTFLTQHTGLPPCNAGASKSAVISRRPARAFTQGSPCGSGKRRGGS